MPKRRNNRRRDVMEVPDLPIKSEEYQTDIEMVRAKLEDLEREKNSRVQNLIQLRLNMESQLKKQFELSLLSLSPEIRDMPIKTFMETCNGDFEEARRIIVNTKVQSKLAGSTPAKMSGKGAFGENRRPPSSVFQTPHVPDKRQHADNEFSQTATMSVLRANVSRNNDSENNLQAPIIELTLDDGVVVKLGEESSENVSNNMNAASRQLALQRLQLLQNSIQKAIHQMSDQQPVTDGIGGVSEGEEKLPDNKASKNRCPVPLAPTSSIPRTLSKTKGKGAAVATLESLRSQSLKAR